MAPVCLCVLSSEADRGSSITLCKIQLQMNKTPLDWNIDLTIPQALRLTADNNFVSKRFFRIEIGNGE